MIERKIRTAIVTGPTGAIGYALCQVLLQEGMTVYAVTHPGSKRAEELGVLQGQRTAHIGDTTDHCENTRLDNKSERVSNADQNVGRMYIVPCDATDYAMLPNEIHEPIDAWFHLAWAHTIGAGRNDMSAQIGNLQHTIDAVRAAAHLQCQVFVGAGSQAEYGRVEGALRPDTPTFPENGYGMAKLCAGQMSRVECQSLGMAHIWPRILSVYGPHDGPQTMISATIRTLLVGNKPALTAGAQMWDYLYAADAAEALITMARHGVDGAIYPLGSGQARPLREYVEILRDAIDPSRPLGFGEISYGPRQVMRLEADVTALQADTGWQARTSFAEGIRETIRYIRGSKNE